MNRKQFTLLLLALLVVGSAGLLLFKRNQRSWSVHEAKTGDKLLPNFRFNDVAGIRIKGNNSDFDIVRREGVWRVPKRNDYPANYSLIKNLLLNIRDIKVARSENVGPSQRAHVGLDEPGKDGGGILIEFKDAQGKLLDSLLVGKRHLRPESAADPFRMRGLFDGCYVLLPQDPQNVLLISDDLGTVSAEPGSWLDHSFVIVENIRSISSIGSDGDKQWELARDSEAERWTLRDNKPGATETLDTTAAAQTVEMLALLSFVDVDVAPDSSQLDKSKARTLFVKTLESFSYVVAINGKRSDGHYQLTVTTESNIPEEPVDKESTNEKRKLLEKFKREQTFARWIYVVEPSVLEPLIRERTQFVKPASNILEHEGVAKKETPTSTE